MHSRDIRYTLVIAATMAVLGCSASYAQTETGEAQSVRSGAVGEEDVEKAIDKLRKDPNLAGERKTRTLKWNDEKKEEEDRKDSKRSRPGWFRWIGDFFSMLGESARVLVWIVVISFVAVLVVWIVRFIRGADLSKGSADSLNAPTHVRDLDIRPESLPDDIGKSALELWERGEHRAALSLLYRGLLSRLVHDHAVPIKHSSTEGECRMLALQRLPSRTHEYVSLLIRTWQGAVYGATDPQPETIRNLCAHFASTLDAPPHANDISTNAVEAGA